MEWWHARKSLIFAFRTEYSECRHFPAILFHAATLCNSRHAEKVQSVVSTRSVTATKTPNIGQIERPIHIHIIDNRPMTALPPLYLPSKTDKDIYFILFSHLYLHADRTFCRVIYLTDSNLTSSLENSSPFPVSSCFDRVYLSRSFLRSIHVPVF